MYVQNIIIIITIQIIIIIITIPVIIIIIVIITIPDLCSTIYIYIHTQYVKSGLRNIYKWQMEWVNEWVSLFTDTSTLKCYPLSFNDQPVLVTG